MGLTRQAVLMGTTFKATTYDATSSVTSKCLQTQVTNFIIYSHIYKLGQNKARSLCQPVKALHKGFKNV